MRIRKLILQGFRAFGDRREMVFDSDLCFILGQNSHGKTSLAEALEFLFCGTTSRRELVATSKQEYCNALRNVHLDPTEEVYVQAEIAFVHEGVEQMLNVKRVLDADYPAGNAACQSTLLKEVGGAWQPFTFPEIGLPGFDSPESTPIIFQHTLRYVSHAGAGERRAYFRRLLSVDDIYTVRDLIRNAKDAIRSNCADQDRQDLFSRAEKLVQEPDFSSLSHLLEGSPPSASRMCAAMVDLMGGLLLGTSCQADAATQRPDIPAVFRNAIAERRARTFDTRVLDLPQLGPGWIGEQQWDVRVRPALDTLVAAQQKYDAENDTIDQQLAELRPFLAAGVDLNVFRQTFQGAKTCPFCLTEDAVTHERIVEIRKALTKPQRIQGVRNDLVQKLNTLEQLVTSVGTAARDQVGARLAAVSADSLSAFIPREARPRFDEWKGKLERLKRSRRRLLSVLRPAVRGLRSLSQSAHDGKAVGLDAFSKYKGVIQKHARAFAAARETYDNATPEIRDAINQEIDRLDKRAQWSELLSLYDASAEMHEALIEREARRQFKAQLEEAFRQVSDAVGRVLVEDKYPALSTLVSDWWHLLRPTEPVNFKEIRPQGTGQRHIDIKATITGLAGNADIERDAAAVFSDSQLNSLGLATFLARSQDDSMEFIAFDDPIQSMDEEHRVFFEQEVVRKLGETLGFQVIVLTHEQSFWDNMCLRYRHLSPSIYRVTMGLPADGGAEIQRSAGRFKDLVRQGKAMLDHGDPAVRSMAGPQHRMILERFAKEVLAANNVALPSDYKSWQAVLERLLPQVEPYLKKEHQSLVASLAKKLNPPSHDDLDYTPNEREMRWIAGEIGTLAKEYL